MAKEYIIQDVGKPRPWSDSYGEYQSYGLALEGIGEPVSLTKTEPVDKPPVIGDRIYGQVVQEQRNGRVYFAIKPKDRPTVDRALIEARAHWAITEAVGIYKMGHEQDMIGDEKEAYDNIEKEAKHFYNMVDKLIGE